MFHAPPSAPYGMPGAASVRKRGYRPTRGQVRVRRVSDARGVEWRVREAWCDAGRVLLFQCAVAGVRSEIRAIRGGLASVSDEELVALLPTSDD